MAYDEAVARRVRVVLTAQKRPHARPMDFTGRPLRCSVYVAPAGFASKGSLEAWVAQGTEFVASLPSKTRRS